MANEESTAKSDSALTADTTTNQSTEAPSAPSAASSLPHAWMNGLTTEQKANADLIKSLSRFEKGIPDLAKNYAEAEAAKGKTVVVPSEGASKEEKATYLKAIGVPEKPDGYKLQDVKLPKKVEVDEEMTKAFLEVAHKNGLTPEQVSAIYGWYMPAFAKQFENLGKAVTMNAEQCEGKLREEFGVDYELAMTHKDRAFRRYFDEEAAKLFTASGLGNSPAIIRGFHKMGKEFAEHSFADGSRGAATDSGTFGHRSDKELASALYGK
jgi:hypothetical protein